MKRLNLLGLVLLGLALASCGALKKNRISSSEEIKLQTSEATKEKTSSASTERIRERVDTVISLRADTVEAERSVRDLFRGRPIVVESDGVRLEVTGDSATGQIRAQAVRKEVDVPVYIDREIERTAEEKSSVDTKKKADLEEDKGFDMKDVKREEPRGYAIANVSIFLALFLILLFLIARLFRFA